MANYKTLVIDRPEPGIARLTLDREAQLNAFNEGMFDEIVAVCAEIETNAADRVVVVTGAGRAFCAGLDFECAESLLASTPPQMLETLDHWGNSLMALRHLSKPVIAAVNGPATGGGLAVALACDVRIVSANARFNAAFIKVGFTGGDMGVSYLLPRVVGLGHASELMLTGRFVDSEEAARIGLANQVVSPEGLMDAAFACARDIATNSSLGVALTKRVLQHSLDAPSLSALMSFENRNQTLMALSGTVTDGLERFRSRKA